MGQWGYYDDQSDPVQDLVISIERDILPGNLSKCKTYTKEKIGKNKHKIFFTDENVSCTNNRIEYVKSNLEKVSKYVMTKIKYDGRNFIIPGIAIYAARGWKATSQFPKSLPKNYPHFLREEALWYSQKQLAKLCKRNWNSKDIDVVCSDSDYSSKWKDWKSREQALKTQIKLFSISSTKEIKEKTAQCPKEWSNKAVKYSLTIEDVIDFEPDEEIELLLLHRNVFDVTTNPKVNKINYHYTPAYFFRNERWVYTHSSGLSGYLHKKGEKKNIRKFEWELNISKYQINDIAWYPLINGKMKPINNKDWSTFSQDTLVGWRGKAVYWEDLKELPKIYYTKEGCLVCGDEEHLCE